MKRAPNGRGVVNRVVTRLRQTYHPTQVILFGSYAYGHPTRDSDIDLLIIKETRKPFYERMVEVRKLVSSVVRGHPFDPIVMTPAEVERRLARGDQFLQEIVTKGKRVYCNRS